MLLHPVTKGTSIFVLLFPLPSSGPLKSNLIHNLRMGKLSYLRGSVLSQKLVYTGSPHQVGVCLCASFRIQLFCVVLYAPFLSVFNSSLVAYLTALTVAARRLCHSSISIWLTTRKPGTQPTDHGHTAATVLASYVTPTHPYTRTTETQQPTHTVCTADCGRVSNPSTSHIHSAITVQLPTREQSRTNCHPSSSAMSQI